MDGEPFRPAALPCPDGRQALIVNLIDSVRDAVVRARGRFPVRSTIRKIWRDARYKRLLRRMAGPRLTRAFADAYPHAFFVEIGANDGEKYDHLSALIRSGDWRGIMVEPVPYIFARLKENYGREPGVILENAAIADRDAQLPFYHVAELSEAERSTVPDWYDGIGSFLLDNILSHKDKIPGLENRIVQTDVPSVTFQTLCAKHGVDKVDLVLIDTEGYDAEVIKSIDFNVHRPRLLIYEHFHLPAEERARLRRSLESLGYATMEEGFDTFCLDVRIDDELTRFWRGLRPAVPGQSAETEQIASPRRA